MGVMRSPLSLPCQEGSTDSRKYAFEIGAQSVSLVCVCVPNADYTTRLPCIYILVFVWCRLRRFVAITINCLLFIPTLFICSHSSLLGSIH
jgi:hypothetical protein